MKYLLDTHIFLWWSSEPERLPENILSICQNIDSTLIISVASAWEIQLKQQLGKIKLSLPLEQFIHDQQVSNRFEILSINLDHIFVLQKLSMHHKDPFDRLLIAQAIHEDAILLSVDKIFESYPVKLLS